ncbi:MAG TPA: hypothetical protein DCX80_05700 [Chloroflexi bacterium]|jgi:hypothetical protein|nr:hypothetical protein [Chloroflexota bacterium]
MTTSRSVVLVEGVSDQIAVETLAARCGLALSQMSIAVVPMGGVHAFGRYLARLGPRGANRRVTGLYDSGEEDVVCDSLRRAGYGDGTLSARTEIEALGFYVCVRDLEEELIRALGSAAVEAIIAEHGDLAAFRTLQKQPVWRDRTNESQLRRFLGSGATRKIRYARFLVEALDPDRAPRPLRLALDHANRSDPPLTG